MNQLTKEIVLKLHLDMRQRYLQDTTEGKINDDKIASIVEKPFFGMFGMDKYDTIYKKAACYIEGFVRFHPFADGNKRTAILAASTFLRINGHYWVTPLDIVSFLVTVAQDKANSEEEIDLLIDNIAAWIEKSTATDEAGFNEKRTKYIIEPINKLQETMKTADGASVVKKTLNDWFAVDSHPEYLKDVEEIMKFRSYTQRLTIEELRNHRK